MISSSAEINNRGELQFSDFTSGTRSKKRSKLKSAQGPKSVTLADVPGLLTVLFYKSMTRALLALMVKTEP